MRSLLVLTLAAVALAAVPAGASAAGCAPQTFTLADRPDDGLYLQAPEITSVTVSVDADCNLRFEDALSNRTGAMGQYDELQWSIDVDNNPATGRASGGLAGTDYTLDLRPDGIVRLLSYDGHLLATSPAAGPFAASVAAAQVGVTETSLIRVVAASFNRPSGGLGAYFDVAPNAGDPPFMVQLSPAVSAPAAPTVSTPATPVAATTVSCKVPKLAGKTLAAAKASLTRANCVLGAVHRHRARGKAGIVLSSTPKAGTTVVAGTKIALIVRATRR